jgi:hypothetical protein
MHNQVGSKSPPKFSRFIFYLQTFFIKIVQLNFTPVAKQLR